MKKTEHRHLEFDFILVGAGPSAMGFLNGVLELRGKQVHSRTLSICVIDRGKPPPGDRDPKTWFRDSHSTSSGFSTLVEARLPANRETNIPVGRGVGGGSNINACLVMTPSSDDFHSWPSPWRESLLSYTQQLHSKINTNKGLYYFRTSIPHNISQHEGEYFSGNQVETPFPSFITQVPLSIMKKKNGKYRRVNYYESLVKPLLEEASSVEITWLHGMQVERLIFDTKNTAKVVGVECKEISGSWIELRANLEVILASGALETPALLIVSGIGPKQEDILSRSILPVGSNLQDHLMLPRPMFHYPWVGGELSPNSVQAIFNTKDDSDRFQLLLFDAACYPHILPYSLASQIRRSPPSAWSSRAQSIFHHIISIIFHLVWFLLFVLFSYTPLYFVLRYCVFSTGICLVTPKSRGYVRAIRDKQRQSKVPSRRSQYHVIVESCYLADHRDQEAIIRAMKISNELCQPWFGQALFEILPGKWIPRLTFCNERDWLRWYSLNFSLPYFHWGGSCGMGRVVDRHLRVKGGITGLRICDASVMPTLPSVPTALTCAGLGYGLSQIMFRDDHCERQTKKRKD